MRYTINLPSGPLQFDSHESVQTAFRAGWIRASNILHPDDASGTLTVKEYFERSGDHALLAEQPDSNVTTRDGVRASASSSLSSVEQKFLTAILLVGSIIVVYKVLTNRDPYKPTAVGEVVQIAPKAPDNTLTREKAMNLLLQMKMDPVFRQFFKVSHQDAISDKFDLQAEAEGYFQSKPWAGDSSSWKVYEPTAKGLAYVVDGNYPQYRMADLKPLEVVAIGAPSQAGGKTVSQVRFKYLLTATPLGRIFEQSTGQANYYSGWSLGEATFSLYDDGWHQEGWKHIDQ